MRKSFLLLSLLTGLHTYSQDFRDTTFSVRGFTCQCKYNTIIEDKEDKNKIFYRAEESACYPGGENEWSRFMEKNLDTNLKGKKQIFSVEVIINKEGNLTYFRLVDKAKKNKYKEALRVLKMSGKWFPAIQNGYCVKSYHTIVFNF